MPGMAGLVWQARAAHWHINSIGGPGRAAALCQLDNSLSGQRGSERQHRQASIIIADTPMDAGWHANHSQSLPLIGAFA